MSAIKKGVTQSFVLPKQMLKDLKDLANKHDMSLSAIARLAFKEFLAVDE